MQTASDRFDIIDRLKRANDRSLVVVVAVEGKSGPFTGKITRFNEKKFEFSIKTEGGEEWNFRVPNVVVIRVITDELYELIGTVQDIRYIEADGDLDSFCGTVLKVGDGQVTIHTFDGVETIQLSDIWHFDYPEQDDPVPWEP